MGRLKRSEVPAPMCQSRFWRQRWSNGSAMMAGKIWQATMRDFVKRNSIVVKQGAAAMQLPATGLAAAESLPVAAEADEVCG